MAMTTTQTMSAGVDGRMSAAMGTPPECLTTQELSIAQISRMVGFRTPSHFTTVFRRVTGVTPKGYRTEYARDNRPGDEGRVR
jgi:AraC-like DNA-binding protein